MLKHEIKNMLQALAFANDAVAANRETVLTQAEKYYNAGYQDALESVRRACGLRPAGHLIGGQKEEGQ